MSGLRTRLERLEARVAEARCVWLYAGWKDRQGITAAGDGVYRVFVPVRPESLAPGLMAILRHPGGAEVSESASAWALAQLALSRHQRSLSGAARILVLITAGGSEPPPAAADVAPPEAEVEPLPTAERPPPAAEGPSPPPATPPPAEWPEWLPR